MERKTAHFDEPASVVRIELIHEGAYSGDTTYFDAQGNAKVPASTHIDVHLSQLRSWKYYEGNGNDGSEPAGDWGTNALSTQT